MSTLEQDTTTGNWAAKILSWQSPYPYLVASLALSGLAWHLEDGVHVLAARLCLFAALGLSCVLLRGPRLRYSRVVTTLIGALCMSQFAAVTLIVARNYNTRDPRVLLGIIVLGVCSIGVAMCVAVTWVKWKFAEPLAIGVVAVALGALCVPELRTSTATLNIPNVSGSALLFATGRPGQDLSLRVSTPTSNRENFIIANGSDKRAIRWVLLLTGDARLHRIHAPLGVAIHVMSNSIGVPYTTTASATIETLSGRIGKNSSVEIGGSAPRSFVNVTSDRSAYSFPEYGEGDASQIGSYYTENVIDGYLGGNPITRKFGDFTITVTGARLTKFGAVTQLSPYQIADQLTRSGPRWTGHSAMSVTYTTSDQEAIDANNNFLVILSILLGVAGAGIITSLQSIIQAARREHAD